MPMSRRALLGAACLPLAATTQKAESQSTASSVLKLSSQEGIIPGDTLNEKIDRLERWGFDGIEFWGGGLRDRLTTVKAALRGRRLKVSAVCAGYQGALCSDQAEERQKAMRDIKDLMEVSAELGAIGVIVVPAFNGQTKLDNREARKVLMDQLPEIGAHGEKVGSCILLEPLNRNEAFFLRQVADGAAMCKEANSPGVRLMADFYHMGIEEPNDMGAILSGGAFLRHVHLASTKRNLPGQDERDFRAGFTGLKLIGYKGYCSLECGVVGNRETEIPKSVQFLKAQWVQAVLPRVS